MKMTRIALAVSSALLASSAFATNGMNMEGYGPISTAMGGTAQAYSNGLGGMMNNPATMGMNVKEGNIFQFAVGGLNPTISSEHKASGAKTDSTGSFIMPGFGYATKKNGFTWGVGFMAQGGMGTDYGKAGAGDLFAGGLSILTTPTPLSGETVRSELAVGRLIVPLTFDIDDKLSVGGSIDYIFGGMDLQMDMDGNTFAGLMAGNGGSVGGSMAGGLNAAFGTGPGTNTGPINDVSWARFDFSDNSNFTQATKGTGFAGKLGATFKLNNEWAFGASYHLKTNMSDFEGDAKLSMNVSVDTGVLGGGALSGTYVNATLPMSGKIKVKDFQWPSMMALGATWTPSSKIMLSADIKRINWSAVMDNFSMTFNADSSASNGGFANTTLDVVLDQNWEDQTVIMLGGQYMVNKDIAVRAGINHASNPVPDKSLNPLFPATIESHITAGFGWTMAPGQLIDVAVTVAPEVSATNPNSGVTTSHSQFNWQAMYTYAWGTKK